MKEWACPPDAQNRSLTVAAPIRAATVRERFWGRKLVVVRGVERGELGEFLGEFVQHENRIGGANRDAGAAIDAIVRVNEELRALGETGLSLFGVDAIHRAGLHAQFILGTGIGNYVCHDGSICNSGASVN